MLDAFGHFSGGYACDFASTRLVVLSEDGSDRSPVFLNLQDALGQAGTTLTESRSPTRSLFATMHVFDGTVVEFQQSLFIKVVS